MGKKKIFEIAKDLNVDNKTIIDTANKLGIKVTSHLNTVSEEDEAKIVANFKSKPPINEGSNKKGNQKENMSKKDKEDNKNSKNNIKTTGNVIIRREVIVKDEQKNAKPKTNNRAGIGFNQERNRDYNIVYRNKSNRPMSINELFGLKPKNEAKKEEPKPEVQKTEPKPEVKPVEEKAMVEKVRTNPVSQPITRPAINRNNRTNTSDRKPQGNYDNRNFQRSNRDNNFRQNNKEGGFNRNNNFDKNKNQFSKGPSLHRTSSQDMTSIEDIEKDNRRDFSSKLIDKKKANRNFDDTKKKATRNRRGSEEFDEDKLRDLKQVDKLSNMFEDQEGGMLDYYDLSEARNNRKKKKKDNGHQKQQIFELKEITIGATISVKDLAQDLKKTATEVIKKLFDLGIMANINQDLDFDTAYLVADSFGVKAIQKEVVKDEDILFDDSEDKEEDLQTRPPVVVVMGHVDHGKTSLLDAIRKTNVIEGEAGGITQHIGAYKVKVNDREITFLDTPGHEAFTAMRARGAQITDVAILVVAADDGVMPQTIEAINHAKAANTPIIVAVNKIDLPGANVDRVKQELMKYELVPEEWGGDTIFCPISAKKNINIENLLEMVLLVADMQNLRANPDRQAKGTVIEARLDKGKGPVASVLVQRGTLNIGDTVIVGSSIGKIRSMKDDKGKNIKKAGPSTPVVITGLKDVPSAGDIFYEVKNEKVAKHLIETRKLEAREEAIANKNVVTLDNLFDKMKADDLKQLNIIVKTDVQGTAEAFKSSLEKLSNDEINVHVIHSSAGAVTESDVQLALAAKAIIIAFDVRPTTPAKSLADRENIEIKQYSVIYEAIEDVQRAMEGMLEPTFIEKNIGTAEVRQVFKVSNVGTIAGCFVLDGKVARNAGVRVIREDIVIHEGKLVSLKRFKDDAKEVSKGFECGLQIEDYNDIKEGDRIECFEKEEVKR